MNAFKPNAKPLLVGSLPLTDHEQALNLVMDHTPEVPLWVQLPLYREEGMIEQFLPGMPGLTRKGDKSFIDCASPDFEPEVLSFFEDFLMLCEPEALLDDSRFAFTQETGKGFAQFLKQTGNNEFEALKGQITGPITFATAVKDEQGRDIFYNDQLRDIAVKRLALNAAWQTRHFAQKGAQPIIFLDEPALAGFGTSAYITITKEDVAACVEEITSLIHREKGLAGIHVCANTQWDMLLETDIDIINFDAFSYFDRFILYPENIKAFVNRGGILALGVVPTDSAEIIAAQTVDTLKAKFDDQVSQLVNLGLDRTRLLEQIFITPSCGTGSLDIGSATRVLELTRDLSQAVRNS